MDRKKMRFNEAPLIPQKPHHHKVSGALGGTRTPDLLVRSQSLYPAELQARIQFLPGKPDRVSDS